MSAAAKSATLDALRHSAIARTLLDRAADFCNVLEAASASTGEQHCGATDSAAYAIVLPGDTAIMAFIDGEGYVASTFAKMHVLVRRDSEWRVLLTHELVSLTAGADGQSVLKVVWGSSDSTAMSRVFGEKPIESRRTRHVGSLKAMHLESAFLSSDVATMATMEDGHSEATASSRLAEVKDFISGCTQSGASLFFSSRRALSCVSASSARVTLDTLDVDAAVFCTSYMCVVGFEAFTAARVHQLVSDGTSNFFSGLAQQRPNAASTSDDVFDSKDCVEVAVHVSVLHIVCPLLIRHWRTVFAKRDAEHSAVMSRLRQRNLSPSDFGCKRALLSDAVQVASKKFERCDAWASPYEFMLTVHGAVESLMTAVQPVDASQSERRPPRPLTADDLLPMAAFALSQADLRHLPSTIAFVRAFGLPHVELSALGYSFTTMEAAVQLLQSF